MSKVGAFELESVLGRGGSAIVWRAHTPGGTPVAVKVSQEPGTALFRRELNAVAGLDHPAIAMVLDHGVVGPGEHDPRVGLHPGAPYIAMELARGSLREQSEGLDWPTVYAVLSTLLEALAHAHARGILHRDVKPGNVLIGGKRSPYLLTDFGLAHLTDPSRATGEVFRPVGPLVGTAAFMAPEQCEDRARDHGPWTDLYAVGGLAWATVTGRPPFGAGFAAVHGHLHRALPAFETRFAVPAGLEGWIRRLMAKDPVDRFGRAIEAARELARIADRPSPPPDWHTPPVPRSLPVAGAGLRLLGLRDLRFVGREGVRAALWRAVTGVVEQRRPAAWLLEAPSGFGKSRLARWLAETAHERLGAEVLRALHAPSPDPREGLRSLVEGQLRCAGLDREAAVARVAAALGTNPDDPRCATLTDLCVGRRGRRSALPVIAAVAEWIAGLARVRPVVVWLDDVQWGLAALELVPRLLALDAPILVVATVQREALAESPQARAAVEALATRDDVRVEHLGPLGVDEHHELVRSVLEVEHGLATRLADRTAGNPLFAVHLVRDWAERGLLELGPEGFRLRDRGEPPLPGSLASTWATRIERLLATMPPEAERWLELAAALGPTIDVDEWAAVADTDALDDLVDALVVAGLAEAGPGTIAFAHGMVREAVSARAGERGVELNRRCAEVLAARAGVAAGRVARHWLLAGERAAALDPLHEAAVFASDLGSAEAAIALVEEREQVLRELGVPDLDPRWADGWIVRGELANLAADTDRARLATRTAAERSRGGRPTRHARALQLAGEVEHRFGHAPDAVEWYDRAAEVARDADPVTRCGIELSRIRLDIELGADLDGVQRRLHALGDQVGADRSLVLATLSRVALDRRDLDAAWTAAEAALAGFRAEHRTEGVGAAHTMLAEVARYRGQFEVARAYYADARALFERLGSQLNVGITDLNLAMLERDRGDPAEALRRTRAVLASDPIPPQVAALAHGIAMHLTATDPDPAPFLEHVAGSLDTFGLFSRILPDVAEAAGFAAEAARAAGLHDRVEQALAIVRLHTGGR